MLVLIHAPADIQLLAVVLHFSYCVILATDDATDIKAIGEVVKFVWNAEFQLALSLLPKLLWLLVSALLDHGYCLVYADLVKIIQTTAKYLFSLSYEDREGGTCCYVNNPRSVEEFHL